MDMFKEQILLGVIQAEEFFSVFIILHWMHPGSWCLCQYCQLL